MSQEEVKGESTKGNALIMFVVLLVFGLILGGVGAYRYNVGKQSASWPAVTGTVTYSRAQPTTTENNRKEYRLSVRYSYSVDGKSYSGDRVTASDMYEKTLNAAQERLKKYPAGGEVRVYYDPDNPASSVLETGMKKNVYILLGAAVCCLAFAGAIPVSVLRKRGLG